MYVYKYEWCWSFRKNWKNFKYHSLRAFSAILLFKCFSFVALIEKLTCRKIFFLILWISLYLHYPRNFRDIQSVAVPVRNYSYSIVEIAHSLVFLMRHVFLRCWNYFDTHFHIDLQMNYFNIKCVCFSVTKNNNLFILPKWTIV